MINWLLRSSALSLALAALLMMFTPFLREFTAFHISGEWLALGAAACGVLCGISVGPARRTVFALAFVLSLATLIEALVIALPALINLVPNPVSYINLAEQQVVIGCFAAGPFVVAGGVLGGIVRARVNRKT